ncbi:MAG: hypothetical protein M3485_10210 [Pseudomonadota bacterium]|nr:hypothetical protein [Pseudomonadota bacterium]
MPTPSKPRHLHVLQGTYRKDRHGVPEGKLQAMDPTAPEGLQGAEIDAWHELATGCKAYLAASDRATVEITARLLAAHRAGTTKPAHDTILVRLLEKVGACPAGRARLHPINAGQPDVNPFDEL